jgi:tetratricopeptide (TPR) repeat protein
VNFGNLGVAQANAGNLDGALATAGQIPAKSRRGQQARDKILKALSEAQVKADHFDAAFAMAREIADLSEKEKALIEIGKAQADKGDLAAATKTAEQIRKGDDRDAVYVRIIAAKARAGDFTAALAAARDISYDSTKAKALTAIALAQAVAGDINGAIATLEPLHQDARVDAFRQLALAIHQKDNAAASKAMEKATLGLGSGGMYAGEYDSENYACAATYAMMGEFEAAEATIGVIEIPNRKADAYRIVAIELAAARGFPEAARWEEKLDDPFIRSEVFTELAIERLRPPRPPNEQR